MTKEYGIFNEFTGRWLVIEFHTIAEAQMYVINAHLNTKYLKIRGI